MGAENGRPAVPYQISQRADFFEIMQGLQTTFNRPIVNSRDEALCGPWSAADWSTPARLHVIFFDNSLAHGSMLFRTGLMQLMLTLIELECVNPRLILDNPLKALLDYSHDATLQAAAPLIGGDEVTRRSSCNAPISRKSSARRHRASSMESFHAPARSSRCGRTRSTNS